MKCYVCHKEIKPSEHDVSIGGGLHRHRNHRQSSILKATPPTPEKVQLTPLGVQSKSVERRLAVQIEEQKDNVVTIMLKIKVEVEK